MKFTVKTLAVLLAATPFCAYAQEVDLGSVQASGNLVDYQTLGATTVDGVNLAAHSAGAIDSARLLRDVPGVSLYGAGAISSLPVIHGMADDRVLVTIDGMGLMPACPNHMNPPMSYIDPSRVGSIQVYAGVVPVSVGGDSIGGAIRVDSASPQFAQPGQGTLTSGEIGTFYRSNGDAHGENLAATVASENVSISYSGSASQSENYDAARSFKTAGPAATGQGWLAGDEVGSSAYKGNNNQIGLAWRDADQLLQLTVGMAHVDDEGFPNQRMDMTSNDSSQVNLRYLGEFNWGKLDASVYNQHIQHSMDFGNDKQYAYGMTGNVDGMPMNASAQTTGGKLSAEIPLSLRDVLRVGAEVQEYRLDDWWPPVANSMGMMGPNTFWNINDGERNRFDAFAEWDAHWSDQWFSQLGLRSDTVKMNAGAVQGYSGGMMMYGGDAAAFNALKHEHVDHNWDWTALSRYTPSAGQSYQLGFAQQTRSPNLYQLYTWSDLSMASVMNNLTGDGNGYVGNNALKPEVARTLSASGDWHADDQQQWGVKLTPYYSYVDNYIGVQRCSSSLCGGAANVAATSGFVNLQYVNQNAQFYGVDLSGHVALGQLPGYGKFSARAVVNYTRGEDLSTGDNLYDIMPLNVNLTVQQGLGSWTNSAQLQVVAAKKDVSQVQDENQTGGYSLFNLMSSYQWKHLRVDFGIDNVFNRMYSLPLGGAYVGQGETMSESGVPWGIQVPGMGRSLYSALNYTF